MTLTARILGPAACPFRTPLIIGMSGPLWEVGLGAGLLELQGRSHHSDSLFVTVFNIVCTVEMRCSRSSSFLGSLVIKV